MDPTADLDIIFAEEGKDFPLDHGSLNQAVEMVFVEPGKAVDVMSGTVQTTDPQGIVRTADITAKQIGYDTILTHPVTGIDYAIRGIDADGAGLTVLTLTTEPWE